MTASLTIYNSFKKYIADGTIDLDTDTFKIALVASGYTPSTSHSTFSDITNELSTANGYTAGGNTLAGVTWTQSGGTITWDANDSVWTATGGNIVARYAVIYKSGTANSITNPVVAYILMDTTPADVTTTDTNTLTVRFAGTGIITLS